MLTNKTFHIRSASTMSSMSLCSTTIHLLPPASCHLNWSRRKSMTLMNGKSTRSSTLIDATWSSIISDCAPVTVQYRLPGDLRRITGMRCSWLTSLTDSIRGSLDNDWTWGVGLDVVYVGLLFSLSYGSRAGINGDGTSLSQLPLEGEFPRAPIPPWVCS